MSKPHFRFSDDEICELNSTVIFKDVVDGFLEINYFLLRSNRAVVLEILQKNALLQSTHKATQVF